MTAEEPAERDYEAIAAAAFASQIAHAAAAGAGAAAAGVTKSSSSKASGKLPSFELPRKGFSFDQRHRRNVSLSELPQFSSVDLSGSLEKGSVCGKAQAGSGQGKVHASSVAVSKACRPQSASAGGTAGGAAGGGAGGAATGGAKGPIPRRSTWHAATPVEASSATAAVAAEKPAERGYGAMIAAAAFASQVAEASASSAKSSPRASRKLPSFDLPRKGFSFDQRHRRNSTLTELPHFSSADFSGRLETNSVSGEAQGRNGGKRNCWLSVAIPKVSSSHRRVLSSTSGFGSPIHSPT
ncbi:hypothetical protein CLOP_g18889 [Closterium sp. NIES-67]|nr:hypothetical protein CLOP_g18889 [Closterium sp. NIES-67]